MKKQIAKIMLKTDQIVSLSKNQTQGLMGGQKPSKVYCDTDLCTFTGKTFTR